MNKFLLSFFFCILSSSLFAQYWINPEPGEIFSDTQIPEINILIHPDSLEAIYADVWSDKEYSATFIFDNGTIRDTILNTGFRLRGNTSRNAFKKSFKISFNSFVSGRRYYGLEKMNLNGEHNDPCVIRAKTGWDLLSNAGVASPRANHVRVFINGIYYGLYINVEHIDDRFVKSRFGDNDGNLFKCLYPADLDYLGANPDLYKAEYNGRQAYDLKINESQDDYSDLALFIGVLNNTPLQDLPCELEKVFNVHDYLQYMAFDILTGNWDGCIYNKNNFYLYHNLLTGQFEYIPYDIDNTLGIDWLGKDWGNRNIYSWNPSSSSEKRPLYTRILSVPEYRNRFSYYINQWIQGNFKEVALFPEIDSIKNRIAPFAAADSFRTLDYGFTYNDFTNAYTQSLGGHVDYGLKPYITTRRNNAIQQLQLVDVAPFFHQPKLKQGNDTLYFMIKAEDEQNASLTVEMEFSLNGGSPQTMNLYDDGQHNDYLANDGIWGNYTLIPSAVFQGLSYYLSGTDITGKTGYYPECGSALFPVTGLPDFSLDTIRVYPNPVTDNLYIALPPESTHTSITVLNALGQTVDFQKGQDFLTIPTQAWESGLYFIVIQWADKQEVRRVVK